jgi:hypothetical protein
MQSKINKTSREDVPVSIFVGRLRLNSEDAGPGRLPAQLKNPICLTLARLGAAGIQFRRGLQAETTPALASPKRGI